MIEKYLIKQENEQEVLYIYLDFNCEFGKIGILDSISKYFKKHKIVFNGTKIVLVTCGVGFATLLITTQLPNTSSSLEQLNTNTISTVTFSDFDENLDLLSETEYTVNDAETVDTSQNSDTPLISNPTEKIDNIQEKTNTATTIETIPKSTSSDKTQQATASTIPPNAIQLEKQEQPVDTTTDTQKSSDDNVLQKSSVETSSTSDTNLTYVTIYRSNGSILKIELEEYLIGVVGSEMPASFNIEALKAQAIVARTYALKALSTNRKLTDTTSTQVYKDNEQLKNLWGSGYSTYYTKIKNAVDSTKGIVAKYNGTLIEAVYYSTSNGYSENAKNVWGNYFPYLVSVKSPYDTNVASFTKQVIFTYEALSNKLGITITKDSIVSYVKNESNRIAQIVINDTTFTGLKFQSKLSLRSTDFELTFNDSNITITTKGYGHGVGMSQYGANEMAKLGYTYKDILLHYYPHISMAN